MTAPLNGLNVKPGPKPRAIGVGLKGKDRELYQALTLAWEAGIVAGDWGLFAPEPGLPPEWWLEGQIYPREARDAVRGHLARLMAMRGVLSLAWGPSWCGRRAVLVQYVGEVAA